ncbi:MAG TPA: hypothetical protein VH092_29485, partial [Urbifossiella sp.]|nr:hypothetical protein [Urbifossiella sp.]
MVADVAVELVESVDPAGPPVAVPVVAVPPGVGASMRSGEEAEVVPAPALPPPGAAPPPVPYPG